MRPRSRFAFLVASVVASLALPARVEAGGAVVPVEGRSDPSVLDVRVAVSVSASGSTRWSEVTIPQSTRVLWLVPARPGASIGWAADGWMFSLEEATAPRILRPSWSTSCEVSTVPERTTPWTMSATAQAQRAHSVYLTAEGLRAAASAAGFAIAADLDDRIGSLYAAGWNLVAIEIEAKSSAVSSGALRITDDGGSILPIALTGSRSADTRITAFTIGAGVASTPGANDIDGSSVSWGKSGSDFLTWRRDRLQSGGGEAWLRESASHAALFDGTEVPGGSPITSVAAQYLGGTSCETSAKNSGNSSSVVGDSLPASTFGCAGRDDLAIALHGLAPRSAIVTRWAGIVQRGDLGVDRPLSFDDGSLAQIPPVMRAGQYKQCSEIGSSTGNQPLSPAPSGGTAGSDDEVVTGPDVVYVGDGCSGGTATTTTYEDDDTTTTSSSSSSDDCSGDTSTSSDDGWDSSDDGDSCNSDTSSSSSSSDSCSGGSSDGGDSDGWDTEDDMSPSTKKTSLKASPKGSKSPFSRYALFAIALILPLRRRARAALERR